jgi:hypothetical protein
MIHVRLYNDQEVGQMEDDLIENQCRFCGCEDRPFVENKGRLFKNETSPRDEFWSEGPFRVHCDHCNMYGPTRSDPKKAILAWHNVRVKRKEKR